VEHEQALILPLIVPSLVSAVGSLDMSLCGKVRVLYILVTHMTWRIFSYMTE
jgi:hypothetical protein